MTKLDITEPFVRAARNVIETITGSTPTVKNIAVGENLFRKAA